MSAIALALNNSEPISADFEIILNAIYELNCNRKMIPFLEFVKKSLVATATESTNPEGENPNIKRTGDCSRSNGNKDEGMAENEREKDKG